MAGVRAAVYFTVPAGSRPRQCRKCPVMIYDVPTARSSMPIRCDLEGGIAPTATEPGRGITHFADCPAAADFRRPRT